MVRGVTAVQPSSRYLVGALLTVVYALVLAGCVAASTTQGQPLDPAVVGREKTFDFAASMPFDWDRMYVIAPYGDRGQIEDVLGFPWPDADKSRIGTEDTVNLVIFVKDGKVVSWYDQPTTVDLAAIAKGSAYYRTDAKFNVRYQDGVVSLVP
jgi:hypothetical protein